MTGAPDDTRRADRQTGTLTARLPLVLALLAGGLLLALNSPPAPLQPGETVVLDTPSPNLDVPAGAAISARDGATPLVLGRNPSENGELVRLENLEPGTYHVTWPGPGYGGAHTPRHAAIVMIDAIDDTATRGPVPGLNDLPSVLIAGTILACGALAARAGRRTRRRLAFAGGAGAALVLWGAWGWSTPTVPGVFAWLLAAGVAAYLLLSDRRPGDEIIVTAALVVLIWPGGIVAFTGIAAAGASLFGGRLRPSHLLVATALLQAGAVAAVAYTSSGRVSPSYAGLDFAECARRDTVDRSVGRECFRALGARLGATLPAAEASAALLEGFDSVNLQRDYQCRTAGVALSYAAARWGEDRDDPRALFVDIAPICDYSSMHGIVAGAFAHTEPATFSAGVVDLCQSQSPDEARLNSPEYSRQCWQAAGIALGGRSRYQDVDVLALCLQAEPYGMNNCTDGYFQELVDQKARAASRPGSRLYPDDATILSLCSGLPGKLSGGCYRYVGEEVFYSGGTRAQGLAKLQDVCTNDIPEAHTIECWYALGMVSVRTLLHGTFETLEQPPRSICPNAPTERAFVQCLHGGGNAIVGLLGKDVDVERICAWFPESSKETFCTLTRRYVDHLKEGDPNS